MFHPSRCSFCGSSLFERYTTCLKRSCGLPICEHCAKKNGEKCPGHFLKHFLFAETFFSTLISIVLVGEIQLHYLFSFTVCLILFFIFLILLVIVIDKAMFEIRLLILLGVSKFFHYKAVIKERTNE